MQRLSSELKAQGKLIGFVPTMGFLHEGHISLVKTSEEQTDITVVSIFVNPTQFAPNEDFEKYPRDFERDKKLLKEKNVDYLFYPSPKEIYPNGFKTSVEVNEIGKILEGQFRPTHFKGVTTVVALLFNVVRPHFAFFGQKDAQQSAIIKQMASDLKILTKIVICPTIREEDGLAKSSRNIYLSGQERKDALVLYKSLQKAKQMTTNGEKKVDVIISGMKEIIDSVKSSNLDYIEFVGADNFNIVKDLKERNSYFVLIACKIGTTRLIDNILIKI
jgi:pantoate--beta-alanine ligase